MQVQYDGTAYLGFASQDLEETVENHLFNALIKLKLIEDRKVRPCCECIFLSELIFTIRACICMIELPVQQMR